MHRWQGLSEIRYRRQKNVQTFVRIPAYTYIYSNVKHVSEVWLQSVKETTFFLHDNVNAKQIFYENAFRTVFKSGRSRLKKIKIYIARRCNSFNRGQKYVYTLHNDTNNNCGYTYQVHIHIRKRKVVELDCVTIDYVLIHFANQVTN